MCPFDLSTKKSEWKNLLSKYTLAMDIITVAILLLEL